MRIRASLCLVFVLALVAPARADFTPSGARAASSDQLIATFVQMGQEYWRARNVPTCPVTVWVADNLANSAYGRAEGTCVDGPRRVVWVLSALSDRAHRNPGGDDSAYLCRIVFHELGHIGGLEHAAGGLMDPGSSWAEGTPWGCRVWAAERRLVVLERARQRAKSLETKQARLARHQSAVNRAHRGT